MARPPSVANNRKQPVRFRQRSNARLGEGIATARGSKVAANRPTATANPSIAVAKSQNTTAMSRAATTNEAFAIAEDRSQQQIH